MRDARFLIVTVLAVITMMFLHAEVHELRLTLDDTFKVEDTDDWKVTMKRNLTLRFADVAIHPKKSKSFSLMLFFKADTLSPRDPRFDTPERMKALVIDSSKDYLEDTVEKNIEIEEIHNKGWYGFKTTLTDASWVNKTPPEGEFKYLTRGMIRLSEKTALGFSLMTNDIKSPETQTIMDYIYSFAKERDVTPTN